MFYDSVDRYDIVTNVRLDRLESHEYWQDSITIYKNILGNSARKLGMYEYVESLYESCTNKR